MSRQDKATTDRNARILRELVKQPDNKSCADCRKNDARWASWNLGVFLCIRCSGIHRSMGTHISKVKSIDLDIWQPEQMESVQKWGNRRANLYWECHLKSGHVPPDHKIESFIRSKYETKRWAMDGPPPSDPRVLENGTRQQPATNTSPRPTPTSSAPPPAPAALPKTHPLLSRSAASRPTVASAPAPIVDLFGQDEPPVLAPAVTTAPPTSAPPAQSTQATTGANVPGPTGASAPAPSASNLFDLDFRAPTPSSSKPATAKADIMSLFSSSSSAAAPTSAPSQGSGRFFAANGMGSTTVQNQSGYGSWNGGVTSTAQPAPQFSATQAPLPVTSGGWGGMPDQSAWGAPVSSIQATNQLPASTPAVPASNPWGSTAIDPWQSTTNNSGGGFVSPPVQPKKDDRDPFANLWN